jgi:hypothetical protein
VKLPWMMLKRRSWNIFVSKPQPVSESMEGERPTSVELLFGSQRR